MLGSSDQIGAGRSKWLLVRLFGLDASDSAAIVGQGDIVIRAATLRLKLGAAQASRTGNADALPSSAGDHEGPRAALRRLDRHGPAGWIRTTAIMSATKKQNNVNRSPRPAAMARAMPDLTNSEGRSRFLKT